MNKHLEIAKLIGQPISTKLPVPFEVAAVADIDTALAGEHVYRYSALDTDADVILQVNTSTGGIDVIKRSALGDTELSFTGLQSKLEYVLVDDILNNPDTKKLSRRKGSITRGMDKREVKFLIDLIETASTVLKPGDDVTDYDAETAEDLYDIFIGMKHDVEDYGTDFIALISTDVKEAIDTYDKDNVASFNYRIGLREELKKMDINEIIKVFGQVASVTAETEAAIMASGHGILVARNSRIAEGKPIKFVRRILNADMAALMGAEVDSAQRALIAGTTPVNISGTNTLGYSIYGAEWVCYFISNPKAIVRCDEMLI